MKRLQDKPNVTVPGGDYSYGTMRDDTGADDGTRANTEFMTDYVQFFERLMDLSAIPPNGLPDNDANGYQLMEALLTITGGLIKIIPIGTWNMDSTPAISIAHGLNRGKIRDVSCIITDDNDILSALLNSGGEGAIAAMDDINITLSRTNAGFFDSTAFDDTTVNRGYVTIRYVL